MACGVHVVPGAVPASDRSPTRSHHPEWHTHDSGVPVGWPRGLCTSPAGLSAHAKLTWIDAAAEDGQPEHEGAASKAHAPTGVRRGQPHRVIR